MSVLFLAFAIVFTAVAQTSYKLYYLRNKSSYLITAIIFFCMTPVAAYMALKGLSLSVVYMSTGFTYVLILITAKYLLRETINRQQSYAIFLIISGVLIYNI